MPEILNLNYYYGNEADQYSFYRIPKILLTDRRYKGISLEAKVLYGLLLDRMGLSARNGWLDDNGRVFLYFTQEEAMTMLDCGKDKATKLFRELEGIGLMERKKQGQGHPARIYVKNFILGPEPSAPVQTAENQQSRPLDSAAVKTAEKPQSAPLKTSGQECGISAPNNTEIIGSTAKMGAGTNVQNRIVASHDLDCPWRPADLEQRAGRSLRQGNMNASVKMFKYVTKGTFDAYNWGLVENKQKFIGQIMTSKSPARSAEDVDATALSYAEVKALATGDDRIREKMDLDVQVSKLKMLKANHTSQQYEMQDKALKYYPQKIAETKLLIEALTADLPTVQAHPVKDDAFSMTVMGQTYTERKAAGEAVIKACMLMDDPEKIVDLGEFRGFPMQLRCDGSKFRVTMKQNLTYSAELSDDAVGNVTRINNALESLAERLDAQKARLTTLESELENAKEEADRPFPKEEELREKTARLQCRDYGP